MERLIFSSNIQNRQCYRFMNFLDRDQYWFCPARYELIDKATYSCLLPEDRAECIPVKQVERLAIQRTYFRENAELREEWEMRTRECTDEKEEELESFVTEEPMIQVGGGKYAGNILHPAKPFSCGFLIFVHKGLR